MVRKRRKSALKNPACSAAASVWLLALWRDLRGRFRASLGSLSVLAPSGSSHRTEETHSSFGLDWLRARFVDFLLGRLGEDMAEDEVVRSRPAEEEPVVAGVDTREDLSRLPLPWPESVSLELSDLFCCCCGSCGLFLSFLMFTYRLSGLVDKHPSFALLFE